jgi:hypothetical protein
MLALATVFLALVVAVQCFYQERLESPYKDSTSYNTGGPVVTDGNWLLLGMPYFNKTYPAGGQCGVILVYYVSPVDGGWTFKQTITLSEWYFVDTWGIFFIFDDVF